MGRTNPLALRVGNLTNWTSNVRHTLLSNYITHIFSASAATNIIVGTPGIRSSTTGIWVNVTLLLDPSTTSPSSSSSQKPTTIHPKLVHPQLDFSSVKISHALGRNEQRIAEISSAFSKNAVLKNLLSTHATPIKNAGIRRRDGDSDGSKQGDAFDAVSPLIQREKTDGVWEALQIYDQVGTNTGKVGMKRKPIHLHLNVISNPVLDASVMAKVIARDLKAGKNIARVYKSILNKLG